jgi:hypothetical protein
MPFRVAVSSQQVLVAGQQRLAMAADLAGFRAARNRDDGCGALMFCRRAFVPANALASIGACGTSRPIGRMSRS